jgi:hypothetical protein
MNTNQNTNQFEKCGVVILPTNEKVNGCIGQVKKLMSDRKIGNLDYFNSKFLFSDEYYIPIHLFILSNKEIKKDDWVYQTIIKQIIKAPFDCVNDERFKKIIATTNKSLTIKNDCDCGATTFEGCSQCSQHLPRPSQQFIEKFIEEYNKGNIITEVLVEYEETQIYKRTKNEGFGSYLGKQDSEFNLKINSDNTINIDSDIAKEFSDPQEFEKCKNDPYYFFTTYCNINGKRPKFMLTREEFNKFLMNE